MRFQMFLCPNLNKTLICSNLSSLSRCTISHGDWLYLIKYSLIFFTVEFADTNYRSLDSYVRTYIPTYLPATYITRRNVVKLIAKEIIPFTGRLLKSHDAIR